MNKKLINNYLKADKYIHSLTELTRHRIHFDDWQEELKCLCGINEALLGKKD